MTSRDLPDFLRPEDDVRGSDPVAEPEVRHRPAVDAPGEIGLWVFVLGDMTIFGAFFVVFLVENRADRAGFATAARELLVGVGVVNTLVLLASSYLVVLAVHAHRREATARAAALLVGAMSCAAVFAVLKVVEYVTEVGAGNTPQSALFFTFYFVLTGVHLAHVVIGTVLLALWWHRARRHGSWAATGGFAEGTGVYWHMVDLLWIVIFTLLYLAVLS